MQSSLSGETPLTTYESVADERDPAGFPAHNRGRGLLKRWAQGVLGLEGEKK
jgi:hypothetical protein